MEPIATVLILVFSICVGLAGAASMLEIVFVVMARPVAVKGKGLSSMRGNGA